MEARFFTSSRNAAEEAGHLICPGPRLVNMRRLLTPRPGFVVRNAKSLRIDCSVFSAICLPLLNASPFSPEDLIVRLTVGQACRLMSCFVETSLAGGLGRNIKSEFLCDRPSSHSQLGPPQVVDPSSAANGTSTPLSTLRKSSDPDRFNPGILEVGPRRCRPLPRVLCHHDACPASCDVPYPRTAAAIRG